ncbi:MAG: MBL fold metallo-hydrolase [Anaerolineales bacterium]
MTREIEIIGCRAGAPADGIPASGYLLKVNGGTILIECGSGVVARLTNGNAGKEIDAIIVTHGHADHCLDLLALAYYRCFPTPLPSIPLYGPAELQETLNLLDRAFQIPTLPTLSKPLASAFLFTPVKAGESFTIAGLRIETLRAQHPIETLSLRFPDLGLVYTSDSAMSEALINFAHGARVLISEATYPIHNGQNLNEHGHMTGALAGELAKRADATQLILTHLSDFQDASRTLKEAMRVFSKHTMIAAPGMRIAL